MTEQHYAQIFERHSEDALHADVLFDDFCGRLTEGERTLSAENLWNLSEDSMLLFTGIDSSNQTSEASEFAAFSDIAFTENPSLTFNQSLEMFATGGDSTSSLMGQIPDTTQDLLGNEPRLSVLLDNISGFYNNLLVSSEIDDVPGWNFDLFESSRSLEERFDEIVDPISASVNVDVPNYVPPLAAAVVTGAHSTEAQQSESSLRRNFEDLQGALAANNQHHDYTPTVTENQGKMDIPNSWQPLSTAEHSLITPMDMPWEWQTFEYKTSSGNASASMDPQTRKASLTTSLSERSSNGSIEREGASEIESIVVDDTSVKKDRRKPKPIARRFQPNGTVTVIPSYVQCLNIVLDYHGYTGTITKIYLNNSITNAAYQPHDSPQRASLMKKPLSEYYLMPPHEELVGNVPLGNALAQTISIISGVLQRKIHIRDITSILQSVRSIAYVRSTRFSIHNPYEPQYYRYELDANGKPVNESKCGMCAFCPTVKFLPFKNSSYLSHMTLEHGIFASNFVVPEGLYYGRYRMVRSTDPTKTRTVKALQCPACFQVIEVACWKNKTNPLLSYFRHFKKLHLNLNKTFTSSSIDPVTLKHRGASISPGSETLG